MLVMLQGTYVTKAQRNEMLTPFQDEEIKGAMVDIIGGKSLIFDGSESAFYRAT